MKKSKGALIIVALLFSAILVPVWTLSQEDMEVVENDMFDHPRRPPSLFRHDDHNEKADIGECNVCHHLYEGGKLVEYDSSEDHRCSDCHGLMKSGTTLPLMKAFHFNCKGCHQQRKAGPVMCGECHRK